MSFFIPGLPEFEKLQDRLQNALGVDFNVEVDTEVSAPFGLIKEHFDLAIFFDNEPIAAIEFKSIAYSVDLHFRQDWLISNFKKVGVKYGILYFGKEDEFHLYSKGSYGLQKFTFDGLVKAIEGNRSFGEKPLVDDVYTELMSYKDDKLDEILSLEQLNIFNELFTEDSLDFDEDKGVISLLPTFEDRFFRNLLPQVTPADLCRYTTLDSLFRLMEGKKYCMCAITCMNDKGEVSYADSYVSYGAIGTSFLSLDENNNCFILSCCDKDKTDDLTMWRLYADNAKGACIEYKANVDLADNKEFFLAPVSYGQSQKCHYELDFIRGIRGWRKDGWRFELKRWYIWKHFFKSSIFADEKEVRLLFIPKDDSKENMKWIMDSTNSIVSRICLFDVNDKRFPLALERALIGPKCPEQTSNVDQFNYMNMKQQVFPATRWKEAIRPSTIEDYR